MTETVHHGRQKLLSAPDFLVAFWECWCGGKWLSPPDSAAYRWCPDGPVGLYSLLPKDVLSMSIGQPAWAAATPWPHVVTARVGRVSTQLTSTLTEERALLVAHSIQSTHQKDPQYLRRAWG